MTPNTTGKTPLALIVSADGQLLAEMIATLNEAGYSCIGYAKVTDVPMPLEGEPIALAVLDLDSANVDFSNQLVAAGTPVVLTSLFTKPASRELANIRDVWLNEQFAALGHQPVAM